MLDPALHPTGGSHAGLPRVSLYAAGMPLSRREFVASAVAAAINGRGAAAPIPWLDPYREPAARLIGAALADAFAWNRLAELTDTFGHRLSGSRALDDAIGWAMRTMGADGLENVRAEPVMVPRWVRGRESLEILSPYPGELVMLGLGNSVGTPPEGLEADLLIVSGYDELERRRRDAEGRIVLVNVPFTDYGATVTYRTSGPSRAARVGAAACLVRSVGVDGLRTPHTGMLTYRPDAPQIPAAAIPVEDALRLQRLAAGGERVRLRLKMEAAMHPDAESANVVGEIVGRERPQEIVVLGGHFDSWDVGTGAIDDGGGCIVTWEALRLMKALDLRPRRTVRVVLFTNEENGLRGGLAYRDAHRAELANHVLMLESDGGVFRPHGFGFTGNDSARATVQSVATLLAGIRADAIGPSGGGADIGPSVQAGQIPAMALDVDGTKYFLYHHTSADTVDKLDPLDVARCAAAVGVMSYAIAELPERLGS
jgi:carboxypeptidase Q